jgi:hypothetical protein
MPEISGSVVTAPHLWALTHGVSGGCHGPARCYYCGGACGRDRIHGEPPATLNRFRSDNPPTSKCPSSPYMCRGCQLFRGGVCTAPFLGGGFLDRQKPARWGWLVTTNEARAVSSGSARPLWEVLLQPPCTFFLALRGGAASGPMLQLEAAHANDNVVVSAQTRLHFTIDNTHLVTSVYDLQQAARQDSGLEGGAAALTRLLGPPPEDLIPQHEQSEAVKGIRRGRPPTSSDPREVAARAVVRRSGG